MLPHPVLFRSCPPFPCHYSLTLLPIDNSHPIFDPSLPFPFGRQTYLHPLGSVLHNSSLLSISNRNSLGPLAIVAATMQLLLVTRHTHLNVTATAVRNVCNATLSLLFTSSLFIWGLLVNRKQAWRTDGGTAVFGCAALALALVSTALNFLYVHKEDEFVWLPGLMWAVVLWQSFLGWWWWVGAGSGVGSGGSFATEDENREEKLRREAKKADKREARKRRKEEKIKSQKISQDITAAFTSNTTQSSSQIHSRTPFRPSSHHTPPYSEYSDTLVASDPSSLASSTSKPESIMSQSSSLTATSVMSFPRILPGIIHRWYLSLRHAHVAAARQQTAKRNHRIEQFHRAASQPNPWWGGFGWRREVKETSEANGQVRTSVYEDPQLVADWQMRRFGGEASVTQMHGESEAEFSRSRTDHDCQNNNGNGIQGQPDVPLPPAATMRPNSMWWWGPLQRWRLQDSTVY